MSDEEKAEPLDWIDEAADKIVFALGFTGAEARMHAQVVGYIILGCLPRSDDVTEED